jgi:hypothetical protein
MTLISESRRCRYEWVQVARIVIEYGRASPSDVQRETMTGRGVDSVISVSSRLSRRESSGRRWVSRCSNRSGCGGLSRLQDRFAAHSHVPPPPILCVVSHSHSCGRTKHHTGSHHLAHVLPNCCVGEHYHLPPNHNSQGPSYQNNNRRKWCAHWSVHRLQPCRVTVEAARMG